MRPPSARRFVVSALVAAAVGVVGRASRAGEADPAPAAPSRPTPAPFSVHEWGTFTSMQGSDGITLEGIGAEEEPLPSFVYSRREVRVCPLRGQGWKGLEVPADHVTQKMETPVLYFHTKEPRRVRVRVDFVKGLISQWYPVSNLLGPPERAFDAGPLDLRTIDRSFLEWDVDLIPRRDGGTPPDEVPEVGKDDPWAFAREVDAAFVRTVPRQGPERAGPTEAEHYLFYRGLGTFALPVRATTTDDAVTVRNDGAHTLPAAFVVRVSEGATHGTYTRLGAVPGGGSATGGIARRKKETLWADQRAALGRDLEAALRAEGMNADEATAMVRTWSRSWFSTEGVRLLYVVPRPLVDALLPLSIDPAPTELRRVLLGRIECVTPTAEKELADALHTLAVASSLPTGDARVREAQARLDRLGRFLEPRLRRVLATTTDADVRREATARLATGTGPGSEPAPK